MKPAGYFERMGRRLWFAGEYYRALKLMQEGLSKYPGEPKLRLGVALAHLKLGNFADARDILTDFLAENPHNGDALAALCEAYLSLGRRREGLLRLAEIYRYHRSSCPLLEHVGTVLLERGLFREAAEAFRKSLKADGKRPYGRLGLGVALSGLHKTASAIRELKKAAALRENFYEAKSYLGNLLYDKGEVPAAIKLFLEIPADEQTDPVTLTRLIEFCRRRRDLAEKAEELERRLRAVSAGWDINEFLRSLEAKAGSAASPDGRKLKFIKLPHGAASAAIPLLREMDKRLASLFSKPAARPGDFLKLARARPEDAEKFAELLAQYFKTVAEAVKEKPPAAMTKWAQAYGTDSLAPYGCALFRRLYDEDAQLGVSQASVDALLAAIVNIIKWIPPGLRGSEWFVELAGVLIAFWTPADMLERLFLLREILSPSEKKSVEPVVLRARAWRRWLGYKAETKWAWPAAELLPERAGAYGSAQPVRCSGCRRIIKDYWNIAQPQDKPPAKCGDCAIFMRCRKCGGPMRQVSVSAGGKPVYRCMECLRGLRH